MSKSLIIGLIYQYSSMFGVDPNIAMAVVQTESNYNVNAVGSLGEVGLFQIRPEYTTFTKKELKDPNVNIIVGIIKLRDAKNNCSHKKNNSWLVCYNAGVEGAKKIKHPDNFSYVMKINKIVKEKNHEKDLFISDL